MTEEKKEVSAEETAKTPSEGEDKGQETGFMFLFFILGLAASLIVGWVIYPKLLYSQKSQPIDFNHALHNKEVEGCESCHIFREDGTYAGVPTLAQCVDCHEEVMNEDNPNEVEFVNSYVKPGMEIPWLIYSKQPDCVFFPHAAHVKAGKMECATCHGHIGESLSLKPYEENRITGYSRDIWGKNIAGLKKNTWDRMKMDDCSECHMKSSVNKSSVQTGKEACFVCHK